MSFWQQILSATGMGRAFPWVVLIFIVVAFILLFSKPEERMRIRTALLLFALSIVTFLIAATLLSYGVPLTSLAFKWTRWAARIFQWLAIINVAAVFVFELVLGPLRLRPPRIMRDLLLALAYIVIAITILSRDTDLTGIIATSAVLTAVIGLSFQDTLGNMMGGMALQMEGAISFGDWIRIDNQEGMVREIRWRHTAIETRNWDTIVIPNSALMKSHVTILGRRAGQARQHRQWVYFNVDFRYSPAEVVDIVEEALRAEPIANIATTPAPNCVLMDFKESYCSYAARYWLTDMAVDDPTNSVVRTRIYFALRRANIPLSIPAQALFVTREEQERQERKRTAEIDKRADALKSVELFQSLTDEERQALAERLRTAPFVRGEAMTRQGAEAHWLYLIKKGDAEVRVSVDGNLSEQVATLHAGDFFGEMGMMTGEPRSATVIALSDVECYRVDKGAFHDIMHSRPEIAEDISHVLARRRVELDAAREGLNEEAKRERMRHHQGALLQRIKNFFALSN
ncbi:MAG: cyclic nucleotide-binding domain-containing protein [Pyrinomonadaceae bacterium]